MWHARLAALSLVLIAATAGCGGGEGDGTETFDRDGFGFTFEYPSSFDESADVSFASGAGDVTAEEDVAIALDESNGIILSRYELNIEVTAQNAGEVKGELDGVMSQLAGRELSGERVEVGGFPGYEYAFDLDEPPDGRSRFLILFDGRTEYAINCQSTPAQRAEVDAACQQALDTLTEE